MLSLQERREIILVYGESRRNINLAVRTLQERFPNVGYNLYKVRRIVNLFEDTSSVEEPKRAANYRVRNNPVLVNAVTEAIAEDPTTSVRRISRNLNASKSSVSRILRKILAVLRQIS